MAAGHHGPLDADRSFFLTDFLRVWSDEEAQRRLMQVVRYEYKVIPFVAASRRGGPEDLARAAAEQFEALLAQGAGEGWEYYRMDHYNLLESPGCLASLFGAKAAIITYDAAVFRRPLA